MRSDPDNIAAPASASPTLSSATAGADTAPRKRDTSARSGFLAQHRRAAATLLLGAAVFGFAYYVLPQIVGLGATLQRLRHGNLWWLGLGVPLEAVSLAAYVALFRCVFATADGRIGWAASYQVTMAGGGATKLFAAAGGGGVALTVWALRASGLASETVAQEMVSFEMINYGVYMVALVVGGLGLWIGLFTGGAPFWLTVFPALLAAVVIALVLSMQWFASPAERFMVKHAQRSRGRPERWWCRAASVPRAMQNGLHGALALLGSGDHSWLAAMAAWGFDIATLWASFRAFGPAPPVAVLIMGYYVGTLANTLPLPGGIGGVEGGMIGAFIGFGVNGSLAVLAVLAYRTISYWLPLLPEGLAYLQLRRRVGDWREHPSQSLTASG